MGVRPACDFSFPARASRRTPPADMRQGAIDSCPPRGPSPGTLTLGSGARWPLDFSCPLPVGALLCKDSPSEGGNPRASMEQDSEALVSITLDQLRDCLNKSGLMSSAEVSAFQESL